MLKNQVYINLYKLLKKYIHTTNIQFLIPIFPHHSILSHFIPVNAHYLLLLFILAIATGWLTKSLLCSIAKTPGINAHNYLILWKSWERLAKITFLCHQNWYLIHFHYIILVILKLSQTKMAIFVRYLLKLLNHNFWNNTPSIISNLSWTILIEIWNFHISSWASLFLIFFARIFFKPKLFPTY